MTARMLDGTKIREQIFTELKDEVRLLTAAGVRPGLAAVLVRENPASQLYVKSKIAACEEIGLSSALLTPPATVTTLDLLAVVEDLNRDNNVDGILIQLPLPPQVDTKRILEAVDPAKDVDGFHPVNLGRLVSGRPGPAATTSAANPWPFSSCTPTPPSRSAIPKRATCRRSSAAPISSSPPWAKPATWRRTGSSPAQRSSM